MEQGILAILVGSTVIGLLESFVICLWCSGQRFRFTFKALLAVVIGAILGGFGGALGMALLSQIAPQQVSAFLLNTFCHGDSGGFGICLWFAAVLFVVIWVAVGSLIGGWLGFRGWLSVNFDV